MPLRPVLPPPMVADASGIDTGEAAAQIESWAVPKFAIADAALRNHHPEARDFVFAKGLKAATGSKGLLAVQTFLQRLDALGGAERTAHAADDRAALALLATRGITVAERQRVREPGPAHQFLLKSAELWATGGHGNSSALAV